MDAYGNNRTFYCSLDTVISDLIAAVDAEVANEL
jgi:hypothetical protein